MFEKFFEILREKETLLTRSKEEAISMLRTCREMFQIVIQGIKEEVNDGTIENIGRTDREINKQQRDIRKMVFEHLAISSSGDLLTGLQLLTTVIDIERIGDYTKNIADLVGMLPAKFDFGDYDKEFKELENSTMSIFDKTIKCFETNDVELAKNVLQKYDVVGKKCNELLKEIITSKTSGKMVEKKYLAMVLLLRYLKRVDAHLKNIATTLVNPFHKIGFQH